MQIKETLQQLPQSIEEFLSNKHADFKEVLQNPKSWFSIPLLNYTPSYKLMDHALVRFRGMIQDMQDPEYYLERYEVKSRNNVRIQEGKYRDCLVLNKGEEVNYNASCNVQGERRILHVVSIPGLNDWCIEFEKTTNQSNVPVIVTEKHNNNNATEKRENTEDMDIDNSDEGNSPTIGRNKRQKINSVHPLNSTLSPSYLLNFPIPERPGTACIIKIYEDFETYSLNSLVDVVGFLSVDPCLDGTTMEIDPHNAYEVQAQNPPPSLIPRLHAIAVNKLIHANPLLDMRVQKSFITEEMSILSTRAELHTLLKLCFFNDHTVGDYLLCHLISTVYSRCEQQSIGKLSLNIWNFPKDMPTNYIKDFYDILQLLIPASHYLPMTLEKINNINFIPKKDYETNKLVSGLLQLAPNTHLVLDETHMQQGKLEENGVRNMQSLAQLIRNQQIKCNFQYYNLDYDVDVPVLIFSEGRSMLPCDISLPIKADPESLKVMSEIIKAAGHYLTQNSRLHRFRCYLTQAKTANFTLDPKDSEMIQHDFVEMRKTNATTNADDLHNLLVLSRLAAIACGKEVLDKESWELAKHMETTRNELLKKFPNGRNIRSVF